MAANTLSHALQLHQTGRLAEAERLYREVLRTDPACVDAWSLLGAVQLQRGTLAEAETHFQTALRLDPNHPRSLGNQGILFARTGRLEQAVASLRRATELDPGERDNQLNLVKALNRYGGLLSQQRRDEAALAVYREALALQPDYAMARNNLGVLLNEVGRFDEAQAELERVIAAEPTFPGPYSNRGLVSFGRGDVPDALDWFEREIARHPEYPEAHRNRAVAWLLAGDFTQGWREFLWRWRCKDYPPHGCTQPLWDGTPLEGRSILLHAEQGLGDTLQFIRYAPLAQRTGGHVVVRCQPALVALLSRCEGIDVLATSDVDTPPCEVRAALMDLPALCGTTLDDVPRQVPYLFTDDALVSRWRAELASLHGIKIGIHWQGNPEYRGDRYRSPPLRCFAPLAREGVHLVSLQKGPGQAQIAAAGFPVLDLGDRLDETTGAFVETAALMRCLDLVITSDTATAHLAGGLGVPVWVVLPAVPDWRWMLGRAESPWYPTMRLFRQPSWGDWDTVFATLPDPLAG